MLKQLREPRWKVLWLALVIFSCNTISEGGIALSPQNRDMRWRAGIVSYVDPAITIPNNKALVNRINTAIAEWRNAGLGVVFVQVAPWTLPRVEFQMGPSPLCQALATPGEDAAAAGSAPVGCKSITYRGRICLKGSATQHTILHEMGHVAGLLHEHTHTKRNDFIKINYPFIESLNQKEHNNSKILVNYGIADAKNTITNTYDFASIMHYPFYGAMFTLDNLGPARINEQHLDQTSVGRLDNLSDGDKELIRELYLAPGLESACK